MTQPSAVDQARTAGKGILSGIFGGGGQAAPENPYRTKAADLKGALSTLGGLMPDPESPGYQADPEQYGLDFQTWLQSYLDTSDAYAAMQQGAFGYVTLPDGTMMPTGDMTPQQRQIWDAASEAKYQNTMNALGLQQANLVADRAQAGFNNQMDRIATAGRIDDTRLRKSEQDIQRSLSGKGESRSRADLVSDTKLRAAPYATSGGKTSFSGNDMGSLLGEYSRFAGIDPNSSLLNYTGTTMVDPESDMARYDELFGVGGELPGSASLLSGTEGFEIPGVPDLGAVPQLGASRVNLNGYGAPAEGQLNRDMIKTMPSLLDSKKMQDERLLAGLLAGREGGASAGGGMPVWQEPGLPSGESIGSAAKRIQGASLLSGRR